MFEWLLHNLCKFRWWLSAFTMLQFGCGGVYEQVRFMEFLFSRFTLNFMFGLSTEWIRLNAFSFVSIYEVTFMHTDTWHNHWTHIHEQCSKYNISRHDTPPHTLNLNMISWIHVKTNKSNFDQIEVSRTSVIWVCKRFFFYRQIVRVV